MTDAEITRALALKVMGWSEIAAPKGVSLAEHLSGAPVFWRDDDDPYAMAGIVRGGRVTFTYPWDPLGLISHAWRVRDRLVAHGRVVVANGFGTFEGCQFDPFTGGPPPFPFAASFAAADTAARAICLCALRAVGLDPEEPAS